MNIPPGVDYLLDIGQLPRHFMEMRAQRALLFLLVLLPLIMGCGRFGVDSLLDESDLSSSVSISASLASNLKADMAAAGVDSSNADLIANSALSLSSSLEGSVIMAFSAESAGPLGQEVLYTKVAEAFTKGAMQGIAQTSLDSTLKKSASGVNAKTPIRTLSERGGSLSDTEKANAVESISLTAVANIESTGLPTSDLAAALTEVSQQSVAAVASSGASASAMQDLVKKASSGATKGVGQLTTITATDAQNMVNAVAEGSVKALSSVKTAAGGLDVSSLLKDVTVALTSALSEVQTNLATSGINFDAGAAKAAAESKVQSTAKDPTVLESLGVSENEIDSAVLDAQNQVTITELENAGTPTFSPTSITTIIAGTSQSVQLSSTTTSAVICYTSNGTEPACSADKTSCASGSLYDSSTGISLTASTTVKAIACKIGYKDSSVSSNLYGFIVPSPSFSPTSVTDIVAGTNTTVQLATTASATICYTTDSLTPVCSSDKTACDLGFLYDSAGGINLSTSKEIKAIACKTGYTDSTVVSSTYAFNLAPPAFFPVSTGTFTAGTTQTLQLNSATELTTICYGVDGTNPACSSDKASCTSGSLYDSSTGIDLTLSTTVKALACKSGYFDSSVVSSAYTFNVATPTFSPAASSSLIAGSSTAITPSSLTAGSTVCYTTDGATPACNSDMTGCSTGTAYSSDPGLSISASTTVKAVGCKAGYSQSALATAEYGFKMPTPSYSPAGPGVNSGTTIYITTSTALNHSICYTIDGTDPACSGLTCSVGTLYGKGTEPIISNAATLKAVTCSDSIASSVTTTVAYTLDSDNDGTNNSVDNCPTLANAGQTDSDGDGLGDACELPVDNLLAFYDFNGNGNEVLRPARDATLHNTPATTADRFSNSSAAINFNNADILSSDVSGKHGTIPSFNLGGDLAISFWVKRGSVGSWMRILDLGNGEANNNLIVGFRGTDNVVTLEGLDDTVSPAVKFSGLVSGDVQLDTWTHVLFNISGTTATVYLNGVQSAQSVISTPIPNLSRSTHYIARSHWLNADKYLNGELDELAIYNDSLTSTEIQNVYEAGANIQAVKGRSAANAQTVSDSMLLTSCSAYESAGYLLPANYRVRAANGHVFTARCQSGGSTAYESCLAAYQAGQTTNGTYKIWYVDSNNATQVMDGYCLNSPSLSYGAGPTNETGGWLLVLNYVHQGGTNPALGFRSDSLPILSSSASCNSATDPGLCAGQLGRNESTSTGDGGSWGHAVPALLDRLPFTEMLFYGKTNGHNRIILFKTSHSGSISYAKTGSGSMNGLQSNYTAMTGHTANIPGSASSFYENGNSIPNEALTNFPFYLGGAYHWGIRGLGTRWEVDDYANNGSQSTIHRIYVR